jgi:hypothetical protein
MGLGISTHSYESPPTRCPVCRYSLEGLPEEHCCPECGEAYDAQTHVWLFDLNHLMRIALVVFAIGITVTYMAIFLDLARNGWTWSSGMDRLRPLMIMTFWCLVSFLLLWGERAIAVGPTGLVLVEYWKTRRYAWGDIKQISWQQGAWFDIHLSSDRVRRIKNYIFYGDKAVLEHIVRLANERLESFSNASTEPAQGDSVTASIDRD